MLVRLGSLVITLVALLLCTSLAAEQQRYTVSAQAPELAVNTRGEASIIVEAADGFAMDANFPSKLWFIPEVGDEVLVAKVNATPKLDEDHKRLVWTVAMTGKKAGKHPVVVKMAFSVCKDKAKRKDCFTTRSEMRMGIVVKD